MNLRNLVDSKRDTQTGKEYIRRALVPRHLSSERVPDVLITRNQSDRRSDCKIIEDLCSLLVFNSGGTRRKLSDAIFQVIADRVVVEPCSEAVILPAVEKTVDKQRDARIARD